MSLGDWFKDVCVVLLYSSGISEYHVTVAVATVVTALDVV